MTIFIYILLGAIFCGWSYLMLYLGKCFGLYEIKKLVQAYEDEMESLYRIVMKGGANE